MTDALSAIKAILKLDAHDADFDELESAVEGALPAATQRLVAICENALSSADTAMVEAVRVGCAKLLVALLPHSENAIHKLLLGTESHAYETHFSLFCFLDQVPNYERLRPSATFVLSAVESYLRNVQTEQAQAAWMAGDMLGDHWPIEDRVVNILLSTLRAARFAAGKNGALQGVACLVERDELGAGARHRLIDTLREVHRSGSLTDSSLFVAEILRKHDDP